MSVLLGINPFMAAEVLRGGASVMGVTLRPAEGIHELRQQDAQALILINPHDREIEDLQNEARPVISMFDHTLLGKMALVLPDEDRIGCVAAEHLIEKGFRSLAFYGVGTLWSTMREAGFLRYAREAGARAEPSPLPRSRSWPEAVDPQSVRKFVRELRPPVGVMAANDLMAELIRDVALEAGLRVPEDVSIIGVDNNTLRTEYGPVPLSSINVNPFGLGREAVLLAFRMLGAKSAGRSQKMLKPVIVPPSGVVARRSTDFLAIPDAEVVSAVRFIAEHYGEEIGVEDVLAKVLISRSTLDLRMKRHIGRTCSDEIARVRLMNAKRLVEEGDLPMAEIASRCGYSYLSHFSHAFQKGVGRSPSLQRKLVRDQRVQRSPNDR